MLLLKWGFSRRAAVHYVGFTGLYCTLARAKGGQKLVLMGFPGMTIPTCCPQTLEHVGVMARVVTRFDTGGIGGGNPRHGSLKKP
jgi:hypothetical protein